ncbi:alpha-N-acetylglucosaminidase [Streptomyces beijiangensis]|uniref:Alpha-N-acetylglucosaminidase C-terminal domain-containing protein n=1 Tax=Streptomyces beijiangensis TaxID=163361 RepID=A0A939JGN2_9ACTN|nr:alpha-N-acetylglucosaminidase TIM-barrel domain-containing protein [Streptomyces beijiangensis]MBO0515356.1 alpha-N-acetylglucosaminidase C-terminal domain-containing protein [Streptomyces beijiangensis]
MASTAAGAAALGLGAPSTAQASDGSGTAAARSAIRRLAPAIADRFELHLADPGDSVASFSLTTGRGRVTISGSDTVALLSGFTWYLEQHAHGQVSRGGDHIPQQLPALAEPVRRTTRLAHRYAYNFCVTGYTNPNWSWKQWEREIDLLAAGGYNQVLVTIGQEQVWYDTFRAFGYSDAEARAYISLPCHQPWQWMSNLFGYDGGMSAQLLDKRRTLGRRIIARMRELGIAPVLPGFSGSVPAGFAAKNPGAQVIDQGQWYGFDRPDWLDTTTPLFQQVAAAHYASQQKHFGLCHAQAIDLLHEGGNAGGVDIGKAAQGVEQALRAADPGYLWIIQAWGSNPRKDLLQAVDRSRMLVLDLTGGSWSGSGQFGSTPWSWGQLPNFGGRTGLFGPLAPVAASPGITADQLNGTCLSSEGVDTNPVFNSLFSEAVWHDTPIDLDDWITGYPTRRYGTENAAASAAWQTLAAVPYAHGSTGGADSLFNAQPSLTATKASANSPGSLGYDAYALEPAFLDLLRATRELGRADTFRFDLVNVARQVLVNQSRLLLPQINAAYGAKDTAAFDRLTARWLTLMDALEQLLSTRGEFLLGRWLTDARQWGADDAERALLEHDARSLIGTWGNTRASSSVNHDYANRDWAGLVSGFYKPRWTRFFASLRTALTTGTAPAAIDWFAADDVWMHGSESYPVEPSGDEIRQAAALAALLHPEPVLTLSFAPAAPAVGVPFRVTAELANWSARPLSEVRPALTVPDGWTAEPVGDQAAAVGAYGRTTYAWTVTAGAAGSIAATAAGLRVEAAITPVTPFASLAAAFNNSGISDDTHPQYAHLDGTNGFSSQALAAQGLTAGGSYVHDGIGFLWPGGAPEAADNVAGPASFLLSGSGTRLGFLGAGIYVQTGNVTVTYTDGTVDSRPVTFPNYAGREPLTGGAEVAADCDYRLTPSGPANHGYGYRIYVNSVPLLAGKTVAMVSLPANPGLHIFAVATG